MKKKILFLLLCIISIPAITLAASSTTHYGLYKPAVGDKNWGTLVNNNFDTLDSVLYGLSTFPISSIGLDNIWSSAGILTRTGTETYSTITDNHLNWDAAYGWGDHASAGYLTSLSGAVLTDQTTGQTIGDTDHRLAKLWATNITCSNAITGSVTGNAGTVTNATLTTAFTNNGGAGILTWPVAGATLTIPAGGGTLGSAAFTDSSAYDAAGAAAAVTPTSLGLVIGTNVQAYDAGLAALSTLADAAGVLSNDGAGNLSWEEGGGTGDITSIGDVTSGAAFDGTQGTTFTFYNAGGNATLAYDGTDFDFSKSIAVAGLISADANLTIGNGTTSAGVLKINEDADNGNNYASFNVPALAANTVYTLPADDGDTGEQLTTDGSGGLTWDPAGANTALSNLADVAIPTSLVSDTDNTDDLGSSDKRWKDLYLSGRMYGGNTDGWTPAEETWVYASASSFTVAGVDVTAKYSKGTRLKFTQAATVKYAVVLSSSFSTDTTVNILVNTDYTIAESAISDNYFSYQMNPQGYPGWFNVAAPALAGMDNGSGGQPTFTESRARIDGNVYKMRLHVGNTAYKVGTNNYFSWTSPVSAVNTTARSVMGTTYWNTVVDASYTGIIMNADTAARYSVLPTTDAIADDTQMGHISVYVEHEI